MYIGDRTQPNEYQDRNPSKGKITALSEGAKGLSKFAARYIHHSKIQRENLQSTVLNMDNLGLLDNTNVSNHNKETFLKEVEKRNKYD